MTAREIVQSLGGPVALGRHLDVRPQAVSLWVSNDRIPLERVPALLRLARRRGTPMQARDIRPDYDWPAVRG